LRSQADGMSQRLAGFKPVQGSAEAVRADSRASIRERHFATGRAVRHDDPRRETTDAELELISEHRCTSGLRIVIQYA
jgi:hypothetical protein